MANTFTMIGPSGVFPGTLQPELPQFTSVSAPTVPPPGTGYNGLSQAGAYVPIEPLPGALGPSSTPL